MAGGKEYTLSFLLKAATDSNYQAAFAKAKQELNEYQKQIQQNNSIAGDISAYERQQRAVQRAAEKVEEKTRAMEKAKAAAEAASGADEKLNAAQLKAEAALKTATEKLSQQQEKLKTQGDALRQAGVNTDNLTEEQKRLAQSTEELKAKQEALAEQQKQWIDTIAEMEAMAATAYSVIQVVDELADAWKECVSAASGFQYSMSGVEAVSGATKAEMADLKSMAKEIGAETIFTATQIADAMEYMGLAGWSATEMMQGMPAVANLTAAAGEDLSRVCDIVTDSMQALGYGTESTTRFCDVLANAVTNANTTVDLMGDTLKYVSSTAGALGYSIEDVSTAIAAMANNGIKGSMNGTALRNVLSNLAAPSEAAAEALDELGISLVDDTGEAKELYDVITNMRSSFSGLTQEQKVQYATTIAGKRGMAGLLALVNTSQEAYDELAATIADCDGAAEKMAQTRLDNFQGSVVILQSAFDALKTSIGEIYLDGLKGGAETLTDLTNKANGFVKSNKEIVVGATAAAGAMGAMAIGVTGVATAIKLVQTVFAGTFLANAAMWGGIAAGAAMIGVAVALATKFQEMSEAGEKAIESIAGLNDEMGELESQQNLIESYQELREEINDTSLSSEEMAQKQAELDEAKRELVNAYPELLKNIDSETELWDTQIETIRQEIEAQKQLLAIKSIEDADTGYKEYVDAKQRMAKADADAQVAYENWQRALNAGSDSEAIQGVQDMIDALRDDIELGTVNIDTEAYKTRMQEIISMASSVSGTEIGTDSTLAEMELWAEKMSETKMAGNSLTDGVEYWSQEWAKQNEIVKQSEETIGQYQQGIKNLVDNGILTADMAFEKYGITLQDLGYTSEEIGRQVTDGMLTAQEACFKYGISMAEVEHAARAYGRTMEATGEATEKAGKTQGTSWLYTLKAAYALDAVTSETMTADGAAKAFGLTVEEVNEIVAANEEYNNNVVQALEAVEYANISAEEAAERFGVTVEDMEMYSAVQRINELTESMDELQKAYDAAYESALGSIQGQGSLLEGLSLDAERTKLTLDSALSNMQEITSYWGEYHENLGYLEGKGLSTDFLTRFCDTSADGVANTQDLAAELAALGDGSDAQKAKIDELNGKFDEMVSQEETVASTTADLQTQYTETAAAIQEAIAELGENAVRDMQAMATGMNQSGQAYISGNATGSAYRQSLKIQLDAAVREAQSATSQINSALSRAGSGYGTGTGYTGRRKAKGGFTAGPELAGEDPRYPVEAVISFNPQYREENIGYLKQAADILGVDMAAQSGNNSGWKFGGFTEYGQAMLRRIADMEQNTATATAPQYIPASGGGRVTVTSAPQITIQAGATRAEILDLLNRNNEDLVDTIMEEQRKQERDRRRTGYGY